MKEKTKLIKCDKRVFSAGAYKNIEEGGVVIVLQDFFFQLLLNAAVHL